LPRRAAYAAKLDRRFLNVLADGVVLLLGGGNLTCSASRS
jgi:hypothetical protein